MEDRNRYAPPEAAVADVKPDIDPAVACPGVARACQLLWLSFFLSILRQLLMVNFDGTAATLVTGVIRMLVGIGIGYLLTRWIVGKLASGRNWMRWLMTVLNVVSLVSVVAFWGFYAKNIFPVYATRPFVAIVAAVQLTIGIVAIVLLHTRESRLWFADMGRRRDAAA